MKNQTPKIGRLLAVGIIAAVICVGMVTGFSVAKPIISVDPVSDKSTGGPSGIISAVILIGMFIVITLTSVPSTFLHPQITIDPITAANVDDHNMLLLTGTTTLPIDSQIVIRISASPRAVAGGTAAGKTTATETAQIISGAGKDRRWKGFVDISQLEPADYTITIVTTAFTENFTKIIESDSLATDHFTLGDDHPGSYGIRKKTGIQKPFIRLNAADEINAGYGQGFTGITSLQPGAPLLWTITETDNETGVGVQSTKGITRVIPGTKGINRWSVVCDTAHMKPARYRIRVSEDFGNKTQATTPAGDLSAVLEFTLLPHVSGLKNTTPLQNSSRYITIDTLPDIQMYDSYLITGTTSIPAGEDLLVQVYSSAFMKDYTFTLDPKDRTQESVSSGATGAFSGASSRVRIVKGNGSENLWSFELRTYQMEPGTYVLYTSKDKSDYSLMENIPGDEADSKNFTLTG